MSDQDSQHTSQFAANSGGSTAEAPPPPPSGKSISVELLAKIIGGIVILVVAALILTYCQNQTSDDQITPVAALTDEAFEAQQACVEAGFFYDAEGTCYSKDISAVPDSERGPFAVPVTAEPAPGAVAPPAPAPVGAPAAPVAPVAPGSTPSETTTTPKTGEGPTLKSSQWTLKLKADNDPSTGEPPPDTLTGGYNLRFMIDKGTVSGTQRVPNLGSKNVTMTGTFNSKLYSANLFASMENLGTISFVAQMNKDMNYISGRYTHNNGQKSVSGSFTMSRSG